MKGLTSVLLGGTLLIAAAGISCRESAPAMEEMDMGPMTEVTFNAEQIAHGGVKWGRVSMQPFADSMEVPGHLVANEDQTARVSASVRGHVISVSANVGDTVTRGQVLVVLQSEDASSRRADLTKATAELGERQAGLRYAVAARERAERLLALKSGSAQDVERARADEAAAQAGVTQAQATVEHARSALAVLEVDANGQIQLTSPIAGVVVNRDVVAGSVIEAGASALVVTNPATLWLECGVTDAVASALKPNQLLHFVVSGSSEVMDARVLRVSGAVDTTTRLVMVRAMVANPRGRLRPEMFVTVRVDTGARQSVITVPEAAIQIFDGKPVVFLVEPDEKGAAKFIRRDVEKGATVDGRTHVTSGLAAGDVVVTEGAFAVRASFSHTKMKMG